jgi:polysaccharide export outer membrane protein
VLWLAAANIAEAQTTVSCVNSLRNTGCNLIGAALNMSSPTKTRAVAQAALLAALIACSNASAQQPPPPAPAVPAAAITTNAPLLKSPPLAPWQQNLTLGPGDVMDISLYGQPDSGRPGTSIGPDGRFSYLQAVDVVGTGLTVDQLRAQLESTLMTFIREPRVVIVPVAFNSKKYYIFGNVQGPGAYPLNTPTTVVEAVARAHGFVTGSQQRSSFTFADLSQAFLVRRQPDGSFAREPVDFESLFQRGELQNNKFLAPDDYLYFPPTGPEQVFVLGEVRGAGPMPYTRTLTALGAITGHGGFTEGAFQQRILVVRGSLQNPETFIVNVADVLRAAAPDFVLKPRDIVYVSRKPWAKAEELLEAASSDFVRAIAVTWTGRNIPSLSGGGSSDRR